MCQTVVPVFAEVPVVGISEQVLFSLTGISDSIDWKNTEQLEAILSSLIAEAIAVGKHNTSHNYIWLPGSDDKKKGRNHVRTIQSRFLLQIFA